MSHPNKHPYDPTSNLLEYILRCFHARRFRWFHLTSGWFRCI